jgi:hypothetical protein
MYKYSKKNLGGRGEFLNDLGIYVNKKVGIKMLKI